MKSSVDNGRQLAGGISSLDTISQNQLPGDMFIPNNSGTILAQDRIFLPGTFNENSIGRNIFFAQGLKNWDASAFKEFRIAEQAKLVLRMEFYNLTNRVTFSVPARIIYSSTPLGRISGERPVSNYVNSGRAGSSRQGQLALRLVF